MIEAHGKNMWRVVLNGKVRAVRQTREAAEAHEEQLLLGQLAPYEHIEGIPELIARITNRSRPSRPSDEVVLDAWDFSQIIRRAWERAQHMVYVHAESGKSYMLVQIVLREHDLEPLAIYQHAFCYDSPAFARPLTDFLEKFTPAT
jgi:hypothetical protein